MINHSVNNCAICEGEFYESKMNDGKCEACNTRFPGVKNREELKKKRDESSNKYNEGSFDVRVEKKVKEVLEGLGILNKCECGEIYFKKSPAQKSCGNCKETK